MPSESYCRFNIVAQLKRPFNEKKNWIRQTRKKSVIRQKQKNNCPSILYYVGGVLESLITSSSRRRLSLPLETQQDFSEARKVCRAGTRSSDGLALGVLEVDDVADPLPRRARGQRLWHLCEELFFMFPARTEWKKKRCKKSVSESSANGKKKPRAYGTHLFSRIFRSFLRAYSS